ncbi:hypothetical protein [Thalassospira marina]|uniref:hypothetical protein n=1 Tax=Thalassospira marina TaxID=2048283 RepID=UPI001054A70A|nr:hypothetical protein [Thalassospira marina]
MNLLQMRKPHVWNVYRLAFRRVFTYLKQMTSSHLLVFGKCASCRTGVVVFFLNVLSAPFLGRCFCPDPFFCLHPSPPSPFASCHPGVVRWLSCLCAHDIEVAFGGVKVMHMTIGHLTVLFLQVGGMPAIMLLLCAIALIQALNQSGSC